MRGLHVLAMALMLAARNQGGAITCPTLKGYSPGFMNAAAGELLAAEKTSPHLAQLFNDHGVECDANLARHLAR